MCLSELQGTYEKHLYPSTDTQCYLNRDYFLVNLTLISFHLLLQALQLRSFIYPVQTYWTLLIGQTATAKLAAPNGSGATALRTLSPDVHSCLHLLKDSRWTGLCETGEHGATREILGVSSRDGWQGNAHRKGDRRASDKRVNFIITEGKVTSLQFLWNNFSHVEVIHITCTSQMHLWIDIYTCDTYSICDICAQLGWLDILFYLISHHKHFAVPLYK